MSTKDYLPYDESYLNLCRELEYRNLVTRLHIIPEDARTFIKVAAVISDNIAPIVPIDSVLKVIAESQRSYLVSDDETRSNLDRLLRKSVTGFLRELHYSNIDEQGNQLPCPTFKVARKMLVERVYKYMEQCFPKAIDKDIMAD